MESSMLMQEIEGKVSKLTGEIAELLRDNESITEEEIIVRLNLKQFEKELSEKYNKEIALKGKWMNLNTLTNDECQELLANLNSKLTWGKVQALVKLLNDFIIDPSQDYWVDLSKALQNNVLHTNYRIFECVLKVHYSMINISSSCSYGFLSLLEAGILLGNFMDMALQRNSNRMMKIIEVILRMQPVILRNVNDQTLLKEIILKFSNFINIRNVADYFCYCDPKAMWFKYFSYTLHFRQNLISTLKTTAFFHKCLSSILDLIKPNAMQTDLDYRVLQHNLNLIYHFLSHKENIDSFHLFGKDKISLYALLHIFLSELNEIKINYEVKKLLVDFIKNTIKIDSNLINLDLVCLLFSPLLLSSKETVQELSRTNIHIFEILTELCKQNEDILFLNQFNVKKQRDKLVNLNIPQILVDTVLVLMRTYVNQSEATPLVPKETQTVINCTYVVLNCNNISLLCTNHIKLLAVMRMFYKVLNNFDCTLNSKREILNLFSYFFSKYSLTFEILQDDKDFLVEILSDLIEYETEISSILIVINIPNRFQEMLQRVLYKFYEKHIRVCLEHFWFNIGKGFQSFRDFDDESKQCLNRLVHLMFSISNNFPVLKNLIQFDAQKTIVEDKSHSVILTDLIEKCTESIYKENYELDEYSGLLLIKLLISNNLNFMLYLESNYDLYNKLQPQTINKITEPIIIDNYTSLRHNIALTIRFTGFPTFKLNDNILNSTKLISPPAEWSQSHYERLRQKSHYDLQRFLSKDKKFTDHSWILQVRRAFKNIGYESYNPVVIVNLLEQINRANIFKKHNIAWPNKEISMELFKEDKTGIKFIIRFGFRSGYLTGNKEYSENHLHTLLIQSRNFIQYNPKTFEKFDWFIGILFLITRGNVDRTKSAIINFTETFSISLLWTTFGLVFDSNFQHKFFHTLSIILQQTSAYHIFQAFDVSPVNLVRNWLDRVFFGLLEFEEIVNLFVFAIIHPPEYLLFYLASIFNHLSCNFKLAYQINSYENILNVSNLTSYKLSQYIQYIERLAKQYKHLKI